MILKWPPGNLPANVIDKVQVMDDKEELLRNGDDNLNNVGKVVNITLKKGIKKGWFGKIYAGGGTKNTYETGAIANIFRDTLQVSLLAYANDLNKPGFGYTDLMQAGGMERSNSNLSSRSTSIWSKWLRERDIDQRDQFWRSAEFWRYRYQQRSGF